MSLSSVVVPVERTAPPSARRARVAAVLGGLFVGAFVVAVLFGTTIAPYRATALSGRSLQPPGGKHLLGTNLLGQDVFSQLVQDGNYDLSGPIHVHSGGHDATIP